MTVIFDFIPAWFNNAQIEHLRIAWDANGIESFSPKDGIYLDGQNLIYEKNNMKKGEKARLIISYVEEHFPYANKAFYFPQIDPEKNISHIAWVGIFTAVFFPISFIINFVNDYIMNRGFGSKNFSHYTVIKRNNSIYGKRYVRWNNSCACACAGSGRAGCSQKDFYKTNLCYKRN